MEYIKDIIISKCYGTASKNSTRAKVNIPKKIVNEMGITEDNKKVKIVYNERKKEMVVSILEQ